MTNDCWYEEVKPVAKPVVNEPPVQESNSITTPNNARLKTLSDKGFWKVSHQVTFDSTSGGPAAELATKNTSIEIVIVLILLTLLICCVCGYCVLKNRGSCFRKLRADERGEHNDHHAPNNDSQRGTGIEISNIYYNEPDTPHQNDVRA